MNVLWMQFMDRPDHHIQSQLLRNDSLFTFLSPSFLSFLSLSSPLSKSDQPWWGKDRGSGGRKIERHRRRRRDEAWKKKRMPVIRALHSSFFLFIFHSFSYLLLFSFFGRLINYANTDHADESSMRGRVRGEESDASKCEFTCCCHDRKKNDGIASEKYQNDSFFSSACYCITFDWKLSGSTWCKITDWKEGKRNEEGERERSKEREEKRIAPHRCLEHFLIHLVVKERILESEILSECVHIFPRIWNQMDFK